MRTQKVSIDTLWNSVSGHLPTFRFKQMTDLPDSAQRYLKHAIAAPLLQNSDPLATAVRLKMHGEIKLKGWQSFQAEQVICYQRGMLWQATVWMNGLPPSNCRESHEL
ncbi:MAG: DUF6544 family protein [Cyanobacteria bacterium J06621_3]